MIYIEIDNMVLKNMAASIINELINKDFELPYDSSTILRDGFISAFRGDPFQGHEFCWSRSEARDGMGEEIWIDIINNRVNSGGSIRKMIGMVSSSPEKYHYFTIKWYVPEMCIYMKPIAEYLLATGACTVSVFYDGGHGWYTLEKKNLIYPLTPQSHSYESFDDQYPVYIEANYRLDTIIHRGCYSAPLII